MNHFSKLFILVTCICLLCTAPSMAYEEMDLQQLKKQNRCAGCNLTNVDLSGADLSRAVLFESDLSNANLSGANLTNAVLFEADLSKANLSGANLAGPDLSKADLSNANLSDANLTGTFLYGAIWTNGSKCTDPTCSNCK